jgi:Protein of unknown function (DUF1565)
LKNPMKKDFPHTSVLLPWIFVVTVFAAAIQMSLAWAKLGRSKRGGLIGAEALSFGALLVLSPCLQATTRYVAGNGMDSNVGTLASPLRTIQRGVNLSSPGDTVIVQNGTYGPEGHYTCGTVCSQNGFAAPVTFKSSGTASAPITVKAANKWGAILDCGLPYGYSGDGTDGVQACDTYFDFQDSASYITIQDFDITRGYWAGVWINGGSNQNIQILGNHFHDIGNRHYVVPTGTESFGIEGVYAGAGTSNIQFDGNLFNNIGRLPTSGQSATDYNHDHGLYIYNGPYTITNNVFYAMTAGWDIQISPGTHDTTILCNTFRGPNPNRDGLIVLWAENSLPNINITIQNNIFYNGRNYAIDSWQASEVGTLIEHNLVYGSPSGVIDTSVITGSLTVTNNRINTDPMFANLAANDYHLQSASPAIDTGAPGPVIDDFDGNWRPQGFGLDVGAYEYAGTISAPPPDPFDFSVSTSANSLTLSAKQSAMITTNALLISGSAQPAAFAVSGVPWGVRPVWSTTSCTVSCFSSLNLSASRHPASGIYVITVTVTADGIAKTANITLTVVNLNLP